MSGALKTGLIIGGAGLAAFLVYRSTQSAGVAAPAPTSGTLGAAPGSTAAATAAAAASTSRTSSTSSSRSTLGTVAKIAAAPIYYPTKAVVAGAEATYHFVASIF